jgi:hypothetical protein
VSGPYRVAWIIDRPLASPPLEELRTMAAGWYPGADAGGASERECIAAINAALRYVRRHSLRAGAPAPFQAAPTWRGRPVDAD